MAWHLSRSAMELNLPWEQSRAQRRSQHRLRLKALLSLDSWVESLPHMAQGRLRNTLGLKLPPPLFALLRMQLLRRTPLKGLSANNFSQRIKSCRKRRQTFAHLKKELMQESSCQRMTLNTFRSYNPSHPLKILGRLWALALESQASRLTPQRRLLPIG